MFQSHNLSEDGRSPNLHAEIFYMFTTYPFETNSQVHGLFNYVLMSMVPSDTWTGWDNLGKRKGKQLLILNLFVGMQEHLNT